MGLKGAHPRRDVEKYAKGTFGACTLWMQKEKKGSAYTESNEGNQFNVDNLIS